MSGKGTDHDERLLGFRKRHDVQKFAEKWCALEASAHMMGFKDFQNGSVDVEMAAMALGTDFCGNYEAGVRLARSGGHG